MMIDRYDLHQNLTDQFTDWSTYYDTHHSTKDNIAVSSVKDPNLFFLYLFKFGFLQMTNKY